MGHTCSYFFRGCPSHVCSAVINATSRRPGTVEEGATLIAPGECVHYPVIDAKRKEYGGRVVSYFEDYGIRVALQRFRMFWSFVTMYPLSSSITKCPLKPAA
jgi:hypothetical protein